MLSSILFCFAIIGNKKLKVPLGFNVLERTEVLMLFLKEFRNRFEKGKAFVLLDGSLSCAETVREARKLGHVIGVIRRNLCIKGGGKVRDKGRDCICRKLEEESSSNFEGDKEKGRGEGMENILLFLNRHKNAINKVSRFPEMGSRSIS